jgi:hypothetical protein
MMGAEDIAVVALGRWLNMGAWCSGSTGLSALECQSGVFQAFGYHFLILYVGTKPQAARGQHLGDTRGRRASSTMPGHACAALHPVKDTHHDQAL